MTTRIPSSLFRILASSLQELPPTPAAIRHVIEEMKKEALAREDSVNKEKVKFSLQTTALGEKLEGKAFVAMDGTASPLTEPPKQVQQQQQKPYSLDLLDETRWKIGSSIGHKPGTWMPAKWGAWGDCLLFQAVVNLTQEPLYNRDPSLIYTRFHGIWSLSN
jgi:hypothetical protein